MLKLAAVVPAYNEEAVIGRTIASILLAGMPREDVYILNDGSTDGTAEIAEASGVRVISNPKNTGKAKTVNRTVHELRLFKKYTHVCFLDADTLIDRGYFREVRMCLANNPSVGVVSGRPKSIPRNWLTARRAFQYWIAHAIDKPAQSRISAILVTPGCAATYARDVLEKIAWSNDTPVEDMDATIQAALMGAKIIYAPRAIVYTQDPYRVRDYIGQVGKRWDRGAWMIMRKYGLLWRGPFSRLHWECRMLFLEPFLYVSSAMYGVRHMTFRQNEMAVVTMFLSTIAVAAIASFRERRFDIVKASVFFPFLWLLDLMLFIGTMPNILKKRDKHRTWFKPERYAFGEEKK